MTYNGKSKTAARLGLWKPNFKHKKINYSISRKLKEEGKINTDFELQLNNLPMEDIIALKLELASKSIGGKLYGLSIWSSLTNIVRDAVLKYALSAAPSRMDIYIFLGLQPRKFYAMLWKYRTKDYFNIASDKWGRYKL